VALSFYDQMQAFIEHNLEQDSVWHAWTTGQLQEPLTTQDVLDTATRMIGVHNEAFLLVAEEIDKLRAASNNG
jgi:hypothetical protein